MQASALERRHQNLRRLYEAAQRAGTPHRFFEDTEEMFKENRRGLAQEWSIKRLFEQFVKGGREYINDYCDPRYTNTGGLMEASMAVDTAAFSQLMKQLAFTMTLDGYKTPDLIGDTLVTTIPTVFNGEKIPGAGRLGDQVEAVNEGNPYPQATFLEEWVDTPETIKRGLILDITKEILFFDQTGLVLRRATQLGQEVAVNREKRILDVVCGITTVYRRNGGAAEATYQAYNTQSTNALVDYKSIDTLDQKFNVMTDPTTGEPIAITPNTLLVPKALENTARRIVNSTLVRQATASGTIETETPGSQLNQSFGVVSGQYVRQRTSSDSTYFYGDPKKAFAYMENWPLRVEQAPANSEASFERDIVARFKVSERGAAVVMDPRYMVRSTA
ncbi:MAG: hypothetical protein ACK5XN_09540 [Bacteroidota bacterium]